MDGWMDGSQLFAALRCSVLLCAALSCSLLSWQSGGEKEDGRRWEPFALPLINESQKHRAASPRSSANANVGLCVIPPMRCFQATCVACYHFTHIYCFLPFLQKQAHKFTVKSIYTVYIERVSISHDISTTRALDSGIGTDTR